MAVELGAHLHRRARARETIGQGMQHGTEITKPRAGLVAKVVRIDTCHLRRHVGPYSHQPAGQLVRQLEGLQIQIASRAYQKRLQVFDERRDDQLIAPARIQVQHPASQVLEPGRVGGQDLVDALGK